MVVRHLRRSAVATGVVHVAALAVAAPVQQRGLSADAWFDDQTGGSDLATTVAFFLPDGSIRSFIWVKDEVILGREVLMRASTGERPR